MPDNYPSNVYTVSGTAGQSVSKTFSAGAFGGAHGILQIHCGYNSNPTSGSLVIVNGLSTEYIIPITSSGLTQVRFEPPYYGGQNSAVTITLSGAGGSVTGYLNIWEFLK